MNSAIPPVGARTPSAPYRAPTKSGAAWNDNSPVFASIDDARNCPLALATLLIPLIEGLYAEGRD